jgi:putative FmdB family regulatory protein
MPLYEYQCEKCGELFEVLQKFADEPLKKHEKCGGHVNRLLSAPAFQFKGSGWYVNDYAKSGPPASNGGPAKPETSEKSEKKDSGSSAPAPAEKSSSPAEKKSA